MSGARDDAGDATGDGTDQVAAGGVTGGAATVGGTDRVATTGTGAGASDGVAVASADAPSAPAPIALDAVASVAKPFRLQFEEAQDSWVLLYPEGMVKLNRSAGETLARCDGERPVADVVAALEEAFAQGGLGNDVRGFLGVALAQGWVSIR